jgi:hypothetical protein
MSPVRLSYPLRVSIHLTRKRLTQKQVVQRVWGSPNSQSMPSDGTVRVEISSPGPATR